ncbi:Rap1a/Tai family immunity protein [Brytella acorum]|uniref:Rap1a/Tai family immunity protein n=1 Tax=Brytella acorum TaxID=2959299 RepID=A0AA35XWG7_9PROT|nr:Rap1a/Tai family immunity protein [Brytella acorum]MDF3623924.1 Rap1a/Tai family immunity protein [Brytella acorum]CAI9120840.1 Rap1a/Tai family immunity protein [Brytella acorum]
MIRRFSLLAATAGMLMAMPAHASRISPMTAEKFGKICTSKSGGAICDAYISGIADAGALATLNGKAEGDAGAVSGFCVPDDASTASMREHVVSWLRAHRDVWDKPVGKGVFAALHESYPCSGGGSK